MMFSLCGCVLILCRISGLLALPAVVNETHILYDQRQSGKYNIHVSIKDVAIIEMGGNDFQDETINDTGDYYYDEEDLTVKPFPWLTTSSTKKPPITDSLEDISKPIKGELKPTLSITSPNPLGANLTTKKTNVIILEPTPSLISVNLTEPSRHPIKEPILSPKQRSAQKLSLPHPHSGHMRFRPSVRVLSHATPSEIADDSRIFKFKARRSNSAKRSSSSILKRLFSMLTSLPINVNEGGDSDYARDYQ